MRRRDHVPERTRAAALDAGLYQTSAGTLLPLREMNDMHLVNALLAALGRGEATVAGPLAAEVNRRGLRGAALDEAERREAGRG